MIRKLLAGAILTGALVVTLAGPAAAFTAADDDVTWDISTGCLTVDALGNDSLGDVAHGFTSEKVVSGDATVTVVYADEPQRSELRVCPGDSLKAGDTIVLHYTAFALNSANVSTELPATVTIHTVTTTPPPSVTTASPLTFIFYAGVLEPVSLHELTGATAVTGLRADDSAAITALGARLAACDPGTCGDASILIEPPAESAGGTWTVIADTDLGAQPLTVKVISQSGADAQAWDPSGHADLGSAGSESGPSSTPTATPTPFSRTSARVTQAPTPTSGHSTPIEGLLVVAAGLIFPFAARRIFGGTR